MAKKRNFTWLVVMGFAVLVIGISLQVLPVQASPVLTSTNEVAADPACNSCHDNLYYNYDLGKAYCVDSARSRCVDCHDGDPTSFDIKVAHANMVAFPVIKGDDTRCQGCHQADSAEYVDRFAKIAGFRSVHYVPETVSSTPAQAGFNAASALPENEDLTWQLKVLLSLGAVLAFFSFVFISKLFHH